MRSGRLSVVVCLTAAARPHARREGFDDGWEELSEDEQAEALARPSDDPLIGEDGTPKQRTFAIDAGIWRMTFVSIGLARRSQSWLDRYEAYAVASGADRAQARKARTAVAANLPALAPEKDADILRAGGFSNVALFFAAFTWRGWIAQA